MLDLGLYQLCPRHHIFTCLSQIEENRSQKVSSVPPSRQLSNWDTLADKFSIMATILCNSIFTCSKLLKCIAYTL